MERLNDGSRRVTSVTEVLPLSETGTFQTQEIFTIKRSGINEDPVTGSAFTKLAPYWAKKLSKTSLSARQISSRGGDVSCEIVGDRVLIAGTAVLYMRGAIEVDVGE